ncbi:transposase domain-containing protein [Nocardiopsis oceani]
MPTPDAPAQGRLTDHLDLGVLAACYPRDQIEDVLAQTGTTELRSRKLPAHVVVRHTIAWGLNATQGTDAVMRDLNRPGLVRDSCSVL